MSRPPFLLAEEDYAKLVYIFSQDFSVPSIEFHNMSCCLCFVFDGGDWLHKTDTGTLHEIIALTSGPKACKQVAWSSA